MPLPEWSLCDRLRKIRRDAHLTQEEMAHRLGIKPVTWAAWESSRNRPENVVELAEAIEREFDVPAAWTLGVLSGRRATDSIPLPRASLTADQWARLAPNLMPDRVSA